MKEAWIKVWHGSKEDYIHAWQTDVEILGIENYDFEELYGMKEEDYKDDIMYDIYYPSVNKDGEFYMRETDGGCVMCDKCCEDMDRMEFASYVFGLAYASTPSKWEFIDVVD